MGIEDDRRLIERFVQEVFVQGRQEAVDELLVPDFRSHTWGANGMDRQGLHAVMRTMATALSDVRFVIEDSIVEGDRVAVRLTASATQTGAYLGLPPSGRRYTIGEIHIFRIVDGRIAEHWHQYDQPGLLRQLKS